jgi:CO/xanthine dehydrogenase Mo-binding subunit
MGRPLLRVEDDRLLRGDARFVADITVPDLLHIAVVRSTAPHARLGPIDLDEARAMAGVVDAFCGSDIAQHLRPLPSHRPLPPEWAAFRQAALAVDIVRYVGEPVAVVVATSRAIAEDAVDRVVVQYDDLPVVASTGSEPAAELFPGHSNVVSVIEKAGGMALENALGLADVVVEEEFSVQRHSGVPLETRGLLARPDADGGLTLWGVAKMPHFIRAAVAEMLGFDRDRVRVEPVSIGGGFGVRGEFHPEDFLVPFAALRVGRPVRWIEDRVEHFIGTNHSRECRWRVRAGATRDGQLVFLAGEVTLDIGAYVRPLVGVIAEQCALNLLGPYRVPSFSCRATSVVSNKTGVGTVRAPGRFEATFAREGILDLLAAKLGVAPLELRDRNILGADDYPFDTGVESFGKHVVYDSGDPRRALRLAAETIATGDPERDVDDHRLVGIGAVPFIESTGLGPYEHARISVEEPGQLVVRLGTTSMGQGHETSFAQIAADAVGVEVGDVVVLEGDPDSVSDGIGTFASRSLVMGGSAIWLAGQELGELIDKLDPQRTGSLRELLLAAAAADIELDVESRFESWNTTYAYGAHAAVVAIDPLLGSLEVLRYLVVADVGRVINPLIVKGQVHGGVVQGLGGALLEELAYSDEGQPLSASFMDYLLPSAHEAPVVEVVLLDEARAGGNPLGAKGAGEIGTIAAAAVVAAAVRDALQGCDVDLTSLPFKPERLVSQRS